MVGQYDPELNLTYWGTGSPSPWSTVTRGTFDAKGLYMNSTLALNPDTGKLVWHYQHIGADPYDQDYAFERIIVPVTFEGKPRKAVITVGKPGIFEALDAATGQFLFARDPGAQNVATAIDPKTGVKTLLPEPLPEGVTRCPGNIGARNFPAGSYSPSTNRYYLPINDICMGKQGDTPSRFLALGLTTMEFAWDIKSRVHQTSAVLTTAGGLVFSATPDRYFRAFDDRDGKVLWESPRLNDIPNAFPISVHGGRQAVHRDARGEYRAPGKQRPRHLARARSRARRGVVDLVGVAAALRKHVGATVPRSRRRRRYFPVSAVATRLPSLK